MAFGLITIQTEDGALERFELAKPSTTVGRQDTNDIVLKTSSVSRYHARFDVAEGGVYLVDLDSVHGTFINDKQINPEQPVLLEMGDVITVGEVSLTFYPPDTRDYVSLTPSPALVAQQGVPFRLVLDEPQQSVAPGARLQLALSIENASDIQQGYRVTLGGLDPDWVSLNRREVKLDPGEVTEVMVTVRPPRMTATRPGRYALTVRVEMVDQPRTYLEGVREIDVVGYSGLGIVMRPAGRGGQYQLALQNYGNLPADVQFALYSAERALAGQFNPRRLHLDPGATGQVALTVRPARKLNGNQTLKFAAVAQSSDESGYQAPVMGYYRPSSAAPSLFTGLGLPLILIGVLAIVIAVAFIVLRVVDPFQLFGTAAATPTAQEIESEVPQATLTLLPQGTPTAPPAVAAVTSLQANPPAMAFATRGSLTLTWQAENFDEIYLFDWDGENVLDPASASVNQIQFNVERLPAGDLTLTLLVSNPGGFDEEFVTVTVNPVLCGIGRGAEILDQFGEDGEPVTGTPPQTVMIAGREIGDTPEWAYVAEPPFGAGLLSPDTLEGIGWVRFSQLNCQGSLPLTEFVVRMADGSLPGPGAQSSGAVGEPLPTQTQGGSGPAATVTP